MFLGHHGGQGERRRSSADSVGDQDTEGKPITDVSLSYIYGKYFFFDFYIIF
jgi:hypothetical protein